MRWIPLMAMTLVLAPPAWSEEGGSKEFVLEVPGDVTGELEHEGQAFVETWKVEAGAILRAKGPRYVVIKLGEFGAVLFGPPEENHGLFRCGAFPLREVLDPTGAGDTFLGALAGYLASLGTTDYQFHQIRDAVVRGTVMASFTCEAFSTRRLESLTKEDLDHRIEAFRKATLW